MLKSLLKQISEVRPLAEAEVDENYPATLSARRGQKRQAAESLKNLTEEYTRELLRSTAFVIVTGSEAKEYGKVASEKYFSLVSNATSLYEEMAAEINPALYDGRSTSGEVFDVLGRILESKGHELGLAEYPQLMYKSEYSGALNNKKDLLKLITLVINEQVGSELAGIHAVRQVTAKAIDNEFNDKTNVVFMIAKDETLALDLLQHLPRLSPKPVSLLAVGSVSEMVKSIADQSLTLVQPKKTKKKGQEDEVEVESKEDPVKVSLLSVKNSIAKK